jgi:hypothetical protein
MPAPADIDEQPFSETFSVGDTVTVQFDSIETDTFDTIDGVVTKPTPTDDILYVADDTDNRYKLEERIDSESDDTQLTVLETGGRIPSLIGTDAFVIRHSDAELSDDSLDEVVSIASDGADTSAPNDESATGDDQFDTSAYGKHSRGATTIVVSGAKTSVPDTDPDTTVDVDLDDDTIVIGSADVADEGSELDETDEQVIDRLKEIHNDSHDSISDYVCAESLIKMQTVLRSQEQHEYEKQYQKYQYQKQEKEQEQDQDQDQDQDQEQYQLAESSSDSDTNTYITCEEDALSDTVSLSQPILAGPVHEEDTWKLVPSSSSNSIQSIDLCIEGKTVNIDINVAGLSVKDIDYDVSVTSQTDSVSTTESASASTSDSNTDTDTGTDTGTDSDTDVTCLSDTISKFRSTDDDE